MGKREERCGMDPVDLDTRRNTLMVSEIFGPTFQGEGPQAGRLAVFLRLGRCNLDCAWCDTPFTWDWKGKNGTVYDPKVELTRMDVADVCDEVRDLMPCAGTTRLVISGGEPMIQRQGLLSLVSELRSLGVMNIDIETNGTKPPLVTPYENQYFSEDAVSYVISPKLPSSGVVFDIRWLDVIKQYRELSYIECADLKFVIQDGADMVEAERIIDYAEFPPSRVWLMPEGRTQADLDKNAPYVAAEALEHEVNYTDRLHIRIWNDKRGV